MEIKEMQMSDIEARKAEIETMLNNEDADLDALNNEVDELNARAAEIKAECEKRDALLSAIAENREGVVITEQKEEKSMVKTNDEIRASKEYTEAYARFMMSEDDKECRALLTENVSGTIPVPVIVDEIVHKAWEQSRILELVTRITQKGNYKAPFEISATDAVKHTEGGEAVAEETLLTGISEIKPASYKKFVRISDEGVDLNEGFVRYVYEEIAYKIVKAMENDLLDKIKNSPATSTASAPGVAVLKEDASLSTVINAIGLLSDEAEDITVVMNKATWAYMRGLAVAANYPVDVFDERRVVWANYLPSFESATEDNVYMIVGDFRVGARVNFPNGEGVEIKYDDLSEAEADIVRIIGRCFAGIGVVAPYAFVNVTKGA